MTTTREKPTAQSACRGYQTCPLAYARGSDSLDTNSENGLEPKAQHQLQLAGGFNERRGGREAGAASEAAVAGHAEGLRSQQGIRVIQVGVVEDVEGVQADSERAGLAEPSQQRQRGKSERAAERKVDIVNAGTTKRVAAQV